MSNIGKSVNQAMLNQAVESYGLNDIVTIMLSIKVNEELASQQREYNSLKGKGLINAMVGEFKAPSPRQQEIRKIIQRVEGI